MWFEENECLHGMIGQRMNAANYILSLFWYKNLWSCDKHWDDKKPNTIILTIFPAHTFSSIAPHRLFLSRAMILTLMREWYSQKRPKRFIGRRTMELTETATYREKEYAAAGQRSSGIFSHCRQKTVTVEDKPDCPASLWALAWCYISMVSSAHKFICTKYSTL